MLSGSSEEVSSKEVSSKRGSFNCKLSSDCSFIRGIIEVVGIASKVVELRDYEAIVLVG